MDAIKIVKDVLTDALSVRVSTEIPMERPDRLVAVSLSGDRSTPYLLRPRIMLTCWETSDMAAHGLALSAIEALQDASADHPYLSAVALETMSREEWTRNGAARYTALLDLTINVDD